MINKILPYNLVQNKSYTGFKSAQQPVVLQKEQDNDINAAVCVQIPTLIAYMNNINFLQNIEIKYFNTLPADKMQQKYALLAVEQAKELARREFAPNQELNWIEELPKTQLKRLDAFFVRIVR